MIALGADHAGFNLKEHIKKYFEKNKIPHKDFGTFSEDSCDYPLFAKKVADAVASGEFEKGVLVCGTGIGISIAANKVKGIRAALCYEPELAEMSRTHNNANVICLGARVTSKETAEKIIEIFLKTDFEGGRHQRRTDEITNIENNLK